MKTKLFMVMAIIFAIKSYSQYDYFNWQKTLSYSAGQKVAGSGIAVDQYDRACYVRSVGSANRVYWQYGDLLGSAPSAAPKTNMAHIADGAGDHLFYINSNNQISCTEYLYSTSAWSHNGSYVTDPIAQGPSIAAENTNQIFYIRSSDNRVCSYYNTGTSTGFSSLNQSAPVAANFSNLIINDSRVFYVTSNFQIGCLKWDLIQGWISVSLSNAPGPNSIAPGSKIQVTGNQSSFSVFFIAPDQHIYQYYYNSTGAGWSCISTAAVLAQINSDIIYSYDEVRYVGTDGNIQSLLWDECNWSYHTLNNNCSISDPSIAGGTNNKIFFYSNSGIQMTYNISSSSGFVYKKGHKLMLNGSPFYAIGMNYISQMCSSDGGNTFFPSPSPHYANDFQNPPFTTQATCLTVLDQHLQDIANLGFNSIRFHNLNLISNPNDFTDPNLYISYTDPTASWASATKLVDQATINSLFQMYDYVLQRAAYYNLKVKFFIGLENGQKNTNCMAAYTAYLQQFAAHFQSNPTIYSYAILQEADNQTRVDPTAASAYRGKGDICYYVDNMYNAIRSVDANHLVNISLMGHSSLFNFDPYILHVDFVSYHPYPDPADNTYQGVKAEIQWINNIMKPLGKPWILGETGYPASNTSPLLARTGSYQDQKNYAQFVLAEAFSAGASGVCWWNYKDVFWYGGDSDPSLTAIYPGVTGWDNMNNYFGIKSHNSTLKAIVGGAGANPTSNVFQDYTPQAGCSPLYLSTNYYASDPNATFYYNGIVKDQFGDPIKNALVVAFNSNYTDFKETFSHDDGSFSLQTTFAPFDRRVTAPGYVTTTVWWPYSNVVLTPVVCGQGNARSMPTSLEEEKISNIDNWLVFPNPTNGFFNLRYTKQYIGSLSVIVTDIIGCTVLKKNYSNFSSETIDLSAFSNGVYFIEISAQDSKIVKKIVKQ